MLELVDPYNGLPSWKYVFPETGYTVKASNFNALIKKAGAHAIANNLDTEQLVAKIEHYLCLNNPGANCHESGTPRVTRERALAPKCGTCGGKRAK